MINKNEIPLLTYEKVIEKINDQENHLLIGNGFNIGLGVQTRYKSIFEKMIESERSVYEDALPLIEKCGHDLEKFIGILENDISSDNLFLKKYINNKVKIDFMKATHEIVKSKIKEIYSENNEGVYILLQCFTNYFTLNYDSLLYLLLLKYKTASDETNALIFNNSLKFAMDEEDIRQNDIYRDIKMLRENAIFEISTTDGGNKLVTKPLDKLSKQSFLTGVKEYAKTHDKGWKNKDIDKIVKLILDEEQRVKVLNRVDDGSRFECLFDKDPAYVFDLSSKTQNLFFLHGAFHIYKDGKRFKKITQETDKALYSKLEEILNSEEKDIVCVFRHNNKMDDIKANEYLFKCYEKLETLNGNMVIIGCSLDDNDNHIYNQIEKSKVQKLYISTLRDCSVDIYKLAKEKFPSKEIYLFDAESISYKNPDKK